MHDNTVKMLEKNIKLKTKLELKHILPNIKNLKISLDLVWRSREDQKLQIWNFFGGDRSKTKVRKNSFDFEGNRGLASSMVS